MSIGRLEQDLSYPLSNALCVMKQNKYVDCVWKWHTTCVTSYTKHVHTVRYYIYNNQGGLCERPTAEG